jgi:RNA polymerase sigma-70 factor (ECF subfamily)
MPARALVVPDQGRRTPSREPDVSRAMIDDAVISRARIMLAREGDTAAFETLLRPLIDPACRFAYTLLRDWQASEDAVQEAAIKAWRALPRLRADTNDLRPWFMAIVANQARSMRRRRGFGTLNIGTDGEWHPELPENDVTPDDLIDVRRVMTTLTEAQRQLLFLHYCLDMPLDQAATVLGLSRAAAKSKLYRALRAMRSSLTTARSLQ